MVLVLNKTKTTFDVGTKLDDFKGSSDFCLESQEDITLSESCKKLSNARNYYFSSDRLEGHELSDDTIDLLWRDFTGYRDSDNFLVLKQNNGFEDNDLFAMKLPKRGNEKYRYQKKKRIYGLLEGIDKDNMNLDFSDKDYTKALFVTFTFNTNLSSIKSAWEHIGEQYNEAITSLRQKYGKISVFRIFEAYKNGYPHIHAVMLFHGHEFETYEHTDGSIRIENKAEFESYCNWHSFIDVSGCDHIGKSINYLSKYFVKDSLDLADNADEKLKAKLTLSLSWLFRKRSFAVSGDFKKVLTDLIQQKSNSNKDIDYYNLFRTLEGINYSYVATSSSDFLEIDRYENFVLLDEWIKAKLELD